MATKNKKEKKEKNYVVIYSRIAIVLLLTSIAYPFLVNWFFKNWNNSGTFGDTFGALNALFSGLALAGVVVTIMMQKTELRNQQLEMQETRKEFLLNRATNIVYIQLEKFEKNLEELTLTYEGKKYIGNDAVSFLDGKKEIVTRPIEKSEEDYKAEVKVALVRLIKLYAPNRSEFEKFAHNAYNSVEVLKRVIYKTNLEINELNDLKNLFFVNIGFINMGVIEYISIYADMELKYLNEQDYEENDIDVCIMQRADIFLKSIRDFYRLLLTEENFETQKSQWLSGLGNTR